MFSPLPGQRRRRKTRKDCEETLTSNHVSTALSAVLGKPGQSARFAKVPKSFNKELVALANLATQAIKEDPFYLPFDVYASPSLQVLMLALHARQQEGKETMQECRQLRASEVRVLVALCIVGTFMHLLNLHTGALSGLLNAIFCFSQVRRVRWTLWVW